MQSTLPVTERPNTHTETLRTELISKQFGKRQVVSNVSFSVSPGQIVGLLGPNGAGKTTSFYMAVGLIRADSGKVWLGDREITKLPIHRRANLGIGYLPQESSVFKSLSVRKNIVGAMQISKKVAKKDIPAKLQHLLSDFQIEHLVDQTAASLSGGERRRVEIARTLSLDPKFVLLDEPFAGVDPVSVQDIQTMIRDLSTRGIGVLITDHSVRETLGICDHAYILNAGEVIAEGKPDELVENELVRKVYLGEHFTL